MDDGNGNQTMQFQTYYLSDVDIAAMTDATSDYTQAVGTEAFDSEKISDISFEEAFGFSYKTCKDLYEVMETARLTMGFDAEYEDASLDDNKKNLLGEESYVYEKTAVFGAAACKCRLRYSDSDKVCLFCSRDGRNEISDFFYSSGSVCKGKCNIYKDGISGICRRKCG